MEDAFARFPSADWVRVAAQANVPLQPVRTPEEALQDPALLADGAVVDVPHPVHGTLRQAGVLYTLDKTPGRVGGPVPRPGEHDAELRAEAATTRTPAPRLPGPSRRHETSLPDGPLTGITVLDLGFAVAGPFGTQLLADLGADVIKVNARRDPFWHATHIAYGANRGKRSIGIDLKHPDGLATLHRLIARADVVHSNMRRGALRRLGVDEASVRAVNPDVIYCHTRGFDNGPRSDSPGNDQTGCSLAGVTYEDGGCRDGGKPFWSLTSLGDTGNGYFSAIGVVQALLHRHTTGQAQAVDTSILNAGLLVASMASLRADGTPLPRPHLDAMQLGLHAGYRLYPATDGWVCVAAVTDDRWDAFTCLVGAAGVSRDGVDLHAFDHWFASRTAAEAWRALDAAGVPAEIADEHFAYGHDGRGGIHDDPEMTAHGYVVKQQHPKVGRFEHFGTVIGFSDTPARIFGPPPVCGQHTREILTEHGVTGDEIDALLAAGAIFEEIWVD
jgi:crotonobetainyl-CoA:carnitine CoA-transferase CaiB-like acyl-CoA transferase